MNFLKLFDLYESTQSLVSTLNNDKITNSFQLVENIFEDKRQDANIKVMLFGVYNAGKSTLLNALLGDDKAEMGDIPLTSQIQEYKWKNYTIYDTPGIDAPKEHEAVTVEHLKKVDGIIFVVNPTGAAEEEKTLKILVDLLADQKKVFLVLNEKTNLSDDTYIHLKDSIRKRIQDIAEKRGLDNILKDIPILRVNAARALKGRLNGKKGLINSSGFNELTQNLDEFLSGITEKSICERLSHVLTQFLIEAENVLLGYGKGTLIADYNELLQEISNEHQESRGRLKNIAARQRTLVYKECRKALLDRQKDSDVEGIISTVLEKNLKTIEHELEQEAQALSIQFQTKISNLEKLVIEAQHLTTDQNINLQNPEEQNVVDYDATGESEGGLTFANVASGVDMVGKLAKPEHIVSGLSLVKDWMPSLMKGIGPKTMEKIAGQVIGKWIPYVGVAVNAISSIWSMFQENAEEKAMQRRIDEQRKAHERYMQQIDESASEIADGFEESIHHIIKLNFDEWVNQLIEKIQDVIGGLGSEEQINQSAIVSINKIKGEVINALA